MANGINLLYSRLNENPGTCSECGKRRKVSRLWEIHGVSLGEPVCRGCEKKFVDPAQIVSHSAVQYIIQYGNERYITGRDEG